VQLVQPEILERVDLLEQLDLLEKLETLVQPVQRAQLVLLDQW
jgi:hypothetical protein